ISVQRKESAFRQNYQRSEKRISVQLLPSWIRLSDGSVLLRVFGSTSPLLGSTLVAFGSTFRWFGSTFFLARLNFNIRSNTFSYRFTAFLPSTLHERQTSGECPRIFLYHGLQLPNQISVENKPPSCLGRRVSSYFVHFTEIVVTHSQTV
ncbi:hypothetical protein SAMN02982927_01429, partial [Sporolactobacillus nakayamae]